MSYGKQGWKKRTTKNGVTTHVNSKKGVTVSSTVSTGKRGDSSSFRFTASGSSDLGPYYYRAISTIRVNGAWKRKTEIKRTMVGLLAGAPEYKVHKKAKVKEKAKAIEESPRYGRIIFIINNVTVVTWLKIGFVVWLFATW